MSISYKIPVKNRFFMTQTLFTTAYNAFTLGRYDFGKDSGAQNIEAFKMEPENTYLINQLTVGAIVGESSFLEAIETFPTITIKRSKSAEPIYQQPIPIVKLINAVECSAFVKTELVGETVTLSMSGVFKQIPLILGVSDLKIVVSMSVVSIANTDYNKAFDGPQEYRGDTGR